MNSLDLNAKKFSPSALQRHCMLISPAAGDPSPVMIFKATDGGGGGGSGRVVAEEIYKTDEFRMYAYKIKRCPRTRSHDWTECPYAHRGEKAQRRDPRRFSYCAIACPAFRNGSCPKGDACQYAHGVFEYWLHPARYRTRACTAGKYCERKVCFFAHSPEQLRPETKYRCRYAYRPTAVIPNSADTSAVEEISAVASSSREEKLSTMTPPPPRALIKEEDGSAELLIKSLSKWSISSSSNNGDQTSSRNNLVVFEHHQQLLLPDDQDSELLHLGWITELLN